MCACYTRMNIAQVLRTPLLWLGFLRPETLLHDQGGIRHPTVNTPPSILSPSLFSQASRSFIPSRATEIETPNMVNKYAYNNHLPYYPKTQSPYSKEPQLQQQQQQQLEPIFPNLPVPSPTSRPNQRPQPVAPVAGNFINSSFSQQQHFRGNLPVFSTQSVSPTPQNAFNKTRPRPSGPGTIPPLIPRNLLFGESDYEFASMSPDGLWLAYLAPYNGVKNIFVASLAHLGAPNGASFGATNAVRGIPLNNKLRRPVAFFRWTYQNGTLIYYHENRGQDTFVMTKVNANTRQSVVFVEVKGVRADILALSADRPDHLVLGINDRDPRYFDPYLIDINTGQRQLIFENDRFTELYFDQQLELRLAKEQKEDASEDYYFSKGSPGEYTWELYRSVSRDDALMTKPLKFDQTGNLLFWVDNTNRDKAALIETIFERKIARVVYEPTQSDISEVNFNPKTEPDASVTHTDPITINVPLVPPQNEGQPGSSDSGLGRPVFVRVNFEHHHLVGVDDQFMADIPVMQSMPGDITIEDMSNDMNHWLLSYTQDNSPKIYYLYDRGTGRLQELFTSREQLRRYPLSRMHPVHVPTRDNYLQVCYLSLPLESDPNGRGRPNSPLATIMWIHGGPTARNSWGFDDWAQFYTNRGYAVIQCNFRGSLGLGKHWLNLGNGQWAGDMHNDIIDAVNWAIGQGITIRDAVAIGGGSYGGYETLVGLSYTPELFSCGIDIMGPSNLLTLLRSIPTSWKPMLNQLTYRIGASADHVHELKSRSPLYLANQIIRPLLVAQGANDPRVDGQETSQIIEAMKLNQIPATYVLFPDEGHGLERQANREAFAALAEMFLQRCLGGRAQPITNLSGIGSSMQVIVERGNMTSLTTVNSHFNRNFIDQDFNKKTV